MQNQTAPGRSNQAPAMWPCRLLAPRLHGRQGELEDASAVGVRVEPQATAMRLDDGAADREPDAKSAALGRVERIENALGIARRDPGAVVGHAHGDLVRRRGRDPDLDDT